MKVGGKEVPVVDEDADEDAGEDADEDAGGVLVKVGPKSEIEVG